MNVVANYVGHTNQRVVQVYREIQRITAEQLHDEEIEMLKARIDLLVTQASRCIDPLVGDKLLAIANGYVLEIDRLNQENDRVKYFGRSSI